MELEPLVIPIKHNPADFLSGMSSIEKIALGVVGTIAAAFAGLAAVGIKSAMEAARVDELAKVNEVLAKNAGLAISAVKAETEEVRSMGIEYAASNQIVAQFIKNHLDLAKASDLARVAQDAAVISGKNSTEAAQNMIWGIITLNTKVLRTAGITFTAAEAYADFAEQMGKTGNEAKAYIKTLTAEQKQQAFLNEVLARGKDVAGAYKAAMEEPAKVLRSFPRYINDIYVGIGEHLTPALGKVVFGMADFLKWLGKAVAEGGSLDPLLTSIGNSLLGMATAFQNSIPYLEAFGDKFGRILGMVFGNGSWKSKFGAIDKIVAGWIDGLTKSVNNWVSGGGPQKLTDNLVGWLEGIDTDPSVKSKILTASINLGKALLKAIGGIDWTAIASAMDGKLATALDGVDWEKSGESLANGFFAALDPATNKSVGLFSGTIITDLINGLSGGEGEKAVSDFWEGIKKVTFQKVGELGDGMIMRLSYTRPRFLGAANESGLAFHEGLKSWTSTFFADTLEWGKQAIAGFKTNAPSFTASANQLGLQTSEAIRAWAKEMFARGLGWTQQMIAGFKSGIGGLLSYIRDMVGQINAELKKIVTSFTVSIKTIFGGGGGSTSTGTTGTHTGGSPAPKRASGGAVIAGHLYNVNELGKPEYFMPTTNGRISPNPSSSTTVARIDKRDMETLADIIVQKALRLA